MPASSAAASAKAGTPRARAATRSRRTGSGSATAASDHVAGGGRGGEVADLGEPAGADEPDPDGAGHEALRSWSTAGAPTVVIATSGPGR